MFEEREEGDGVQKRKNEKRGEVQEAEEEYCVLEWNDSEVAEDRKEKSREMEEVEIAHQASTVFESVAFSATCLVVLSMAVHGAYLKQDSDEDKREENEGAIQIRDGKIRAGAEID